MNLSIKKLSIYPPSSIADHQDGWSAQDRGGRVQKGHGEYRGQEHLLFYNILLNGILLYHQGSQALLLICKTTMLKK